MAKSYEKSKGRGKNRRYMSIYYDVLEHENFIKLTPYAIKLLIDIHQQYKGHNNGNLIVAWFYMHGKKGWKSKTTLKKSLDELLYYGFIIRTKHSGQHHCGRYAVTLLFVENLVH